MVVFQALDLWREQRLDHAAYMPTSLLDLDTVLHGGLPSGTITEVSLPDLDTVLHGGLPSSTITEVSLPDLDTVLHGGLPSGLSLR